MEDRVGGTKSLLEVRDLRVYFEGRRGVVRAVDGVDLELRPSEVFGLVGESGSGKSVLALSILRLVDWPGWVEGGEIWFEGRDLLSLPLVEMEGLRGDRIAMIFQDPMMSLNPCYSVGFQIKEVLRLHRDLRGRDLHRRAVELLEMVAISSPERRLRDYPFALSGGMRQRVMIAMAMACQPDLLIADEPTTALDVTIQAQILSLMMGLRERHRMSILLITHDLGVVRRVADRVGVMYLGRMMEVGLAERVFSFPRHPYTLGLMRSVPSMRLERRSRLFTIPESSVVSEDLRGGCVFWPRCSRAQEVCRREVPRLEEVEEGHRVACFFPLEG